MKKIKKIFTQELTGFGKNLSYALALTFGILVIALSIFALPDTHGGRLFFPNSENELGYYQMMANYILTTCSQESLDTIRFVFSIQIIPFVAFGLLIFGMLLFRIFLEEVHDTNFVNSPEEMFRIFGLMLFVVLYAGFLELTSNMNSNEIINPKAKKELSIVQPSPNFRDIKEKKDLDLESCKVYIIKSIEEIK